MHSLLATRVALPLGLLAAAGFLSSAGARVIDSLLHVIATDFQVSISTVSIIIAAFTLPYGLNQLILGPVGDRFGKLRLMLGALIGYAVFTGLCGLASSLPALTLFRALAGASSAGLIPVCMAYIGDAVPYEQRQVTLSRFLMGIVLAQTLAGPLGGIMGEYVGWRGVFLLLAGSAILVTAALALRMRNLPDQRRPGPMFRPDVYRALVTHRLGRLLLLASALDGVLFVGCFPFIAPYLHERFALSYGQVGLMLGCFGLGAWAYTSTARRMVARLGEGLIVLIGGLIMAASIATAGLATWWAAFIPVELCLGLGFFMLHAVLQARMTELLPEARATAVAMFAFWLFMGQSAGALLVGELIDQIGYRRTFLLDGAAIIALTLWLSWLIGRSMVRRPAETPIAPSAARQTAGLQGTP